MMEKRITFSPANQDCEIEEVNLNKPLIKTASSVSREIKDFIEKKIKSDPKFSYILVAALGAGEIWGPNVNGDYFTEKEIKRCHKTFETFGHAFSHHQNKDPKTAQGKVVFSHYNDRMRRVELIIRLDREKAPQIAKDIDSGKMWDVSMGCKVPFDVCSICNNHAKTRAEYCDHLKKHMTKVLPDGRQVYAINPNPRFFDISFVWVGADKTAKTLAKVASVVEKKSSIKKYVPMQTISGDAAHMASLLIDEFRKLHEVEPELDDDSIEECASHPLEDTLTTLTSLGIFVRPREFKKIIIIRGEPPEDYDAFGGNIIEDLVRKIGGRFMEDRSMFRPYLLPRMLKISYVRHPGVRPPIQKKNGINLAQPAILALYAIYQKYLHTLPHAQAEGLDEVFKKHPGLLALATAGATIIASGAASKDRTNREEDRPYYLQKHAGDLGGRTIIGVPAAYLASGLMQHKRGGLGGLIKNYPWLIAMLGIGLTNTADDWKVIADAFNMAGPKKILPADIIKGDMPVSKILHKYSSVVSSTAEEPIWLKDGATLLSVKELIK